MKADRPRLVLDQNRRTERDASKRPFSILQFEVNIGSSMVANGIMGMVVGYITHLVVDMAFLVQVGPILRFILRSKGDPFLPCGRLLRVSFGGF